MSDEHNQLHRGRSTRCSRLLDGLMNLFRRMVYGGLTILATGTSFGGWKLLLIIVVSSYSLAHHSFARSVLRIDIICACTFGILIIPNPRIILCSSLTYCPRPSLIPMKFLPSHAASPGSTIYATTYLTFSGELERPEHVEVM